MSPSARSARRTHTLADSAIRGMMREAVRYNAIDLAPGVPDLPTPELLKEAACAAIRGDMNQYAMACGTPVIRHALANKYAEWYGLEVDPEREITVTCGSMEAMAAVMLALVNPGDEVVIVEPFFESFAPDVLLCGARPIYLPLAPPDFRLEQEALEHVLTPRTRAVVINSPNNPTGRVFDGSELSAVAAVCRERDLLAITDEVYEHLLYEGEHLPLATFEGMRDRTVTISGLSKAFRVTGWRIGTVVAPADLTAAIRTVHGFLTVGAPTPLQEACAVGLLELGRDYYDDMRTAYRYRRDALVSALQDARFSCTPPQGAYYVLADFSALSNEDDTAFAKRLVREAGVAAVPGSSFFSLPERGRSLLRFAFCKSTETLREAGKRLGEFAENESLGRTSLLSPLGELVPR